MPEGFDNRLRQNWRLLFAIADLAGGSWPKRIRAAAVKLTKQFYAPSIGRQCLAMFVELFLASEYEGMITSAWAQEQFTADPTSAWVNYRGRGSITQWGIKNILEPYGIRPGMLHPRGHPAVRGYRIEHFETAFRYFLHSRSRTSSGSVASGRSEAPQREYGSTFGEEIFCGKEKKSSAQTYSRTRSGPAARQAQPRVGLEANGTARRQAGEMHDL